MGHGSASACGNHDVHCCGGLCMQVCGSCAPLRVIMITASCRSSILLPSLQTFGGGMELHTSPWLCTVWLPSLSQIAMPKVLDLDLATILKTLNLAMPAPSMPKLQRLSLSAHVLSDLSDDEDEERNSTTCSTKCTSDDPCVACPSPLQPSTSRGAPSASDVGHCPAAVDAVVPRAYLLQFGALIGERDSLQVCWQPPETLEQQHQPTASS